MIIEKHTVVSVHYRLRENDLEGNLIEETFGRDPLTFLFGVGQLLPEFEKNLAGKIAGDPFAFSIVSAEAYGEVDQEAIVNLPMSTFTQEGMDPSGFLQPGARVPMQDEEGNRMVATVLEVNADHVVLDFNHPLAGVDLYFEGSVDTVRPATADEIAHGHVHGPGGHHH